MALDNSGLRPPFFWVCKSCEFWRFLLWQSNSSGVWCWIFGCVVSNFSKKQTAFIFKGQEVFWDLLNDLQSPEDKSTRFARNVWNHPPNDSATHTRQPISFLNLVRRHKVWFHREVSGRPLRLHLQFITQTCIHTPRAIGTNDPKYSKRINTSGRVVITVFFFSRWPKYYYQFSILTPPNCSIYLGLGTKFYALTKLLNYCNSSQIVNPKNFHRIYGYRLKCRSLIPRVPEWEIWSCFICVIRWIAMQIGKLVMKKRPIRNRIHHSLSNTELSQITSVYMLTIYLTNINFNLLTSHINAYHLLSHSH